LAANSASNAHRPLFGLGFDGEILAPAIYPFTTGVNLIKFLPLDGANFGCDLRKSDLLDMTSLSEKYGLEFIHSVFVWTDWSMFNTLNGS